MTIYDLTSLFVDAYLQEIAIYDLNSERIIYKGNIENMSESCDEFGNSYEDLESLEVLSIDCIENNIITVNVEM